MLRLGIDKSEDPGNYETLINLQMADDPVEILFESRWLNLYRRGRWEYVRRPAANEAVGILALTAQDEYLFIEQFRVPVQCRVIEIPAGIVGDEPEFAGEALAETARRELLEETGYAAASVELLVTSPTSAGMTSEFTHLFFASDLTQQHGGGGVGHEEITVHRVPRAEVRGWLRAREAEGCAVDFKIHAALWAVEEKAENLKS